MPVRTNTARLTTVRRPTTTGVSPSPSSAALQKKATDWIKANSGDTWGKKFPAVDSGNLGMSAFVPTTAQAKSILATAKALAPGLPELQQAKLDPAKQQLVVVLTSDDEPALHLSLQDKKTGGMKYLGEINTVDLGSDEDLGTALGRMARGAKWLPLGPGSAEPNWWE